MAACTTGIWFIGWLGRSWLADVFERVVVCSLLSSCKCAVQLFDAGGSPTTVSGVLSPSSQARVASAKWRWLVWEVLSFPFRGVGTPASPHRLNRLTASFFGRFLSGGTCFVDDGAYTSVSLAVSFKSARLAALRGLPCQF